MKVRRFILLGGVAVAVLAAVLILLPWLQITYVTRNGTMGAPGEGASLDYVFDVDDANYSNSGGSEEHYQQFAGFLTLDDKGSSLQTHEQLTPIGGSTVLRTYSMNADAPFAESFLNSWVIGTGATLSVDGQTASVVGIATPYSVLFEGSLPANVSESVSVIGETLPWELSPVDPNEVGVDTEISGQVPPLQFDYDTASGSNVLVAAVFSGNASFVTGLLPDLGITSVTGLEINLIGTNVALEPLDLSYYLTQNLVLTIAVCVVAVVFLLLVVRRSRMRSRREQGRPNNRERDPIDGS